MKFSFFFFLKKDLNQISVWIIVRYIKEKRNKEISQQVKHSNYNRQVKYDGNNFADENKFAENRRNYWWFCDR